MNEKTAFWEKWRRGLWIACLGAAVGVALFCWVDVVAIWLVAGLAAAAVVSGIAAGRARPSETDNVKALSELVSLSPMAREVFENLPDPLMLVDDDERVLFANRAMRTVTGVGVEHKHVSSLLRMPSVLEALARTVASGDAATVEFSVRVPVERHFQAYTARAGASPTTTTMLLLHDLTALKRAEQMRVDFVANASHELRTPLAAVTGFIETLRGPAKDDVDAREQFLGIMYVEAERMRRLIDDLLSLSRIEMNEHVVPQGEVSAESLAQEAAAALSPLAKAENIAVTVVAEAGLPPITGERDELIQLFQNLIHNAIKYGRENGHVAVTLRRVPAAGRGAANLVAIAIADDGEGIPQDAIPRLTERFYRVDVKRSREKGGTGLGLAIVKHIVNRHSGRLQVESRIGEGSTFTVFLPAAHHAGETPPAAKAADGKNAESVVI
jgi:two-component system, OmpR family, phosphate regulon sensor histidine kinase PhoR